MLFIVCIELIMYKGEVRGLHSRPENTGLEVYYAVVKFELPYLVCKPPENQTISMTCETCIPHIQRKGRDPRVIYLDVKSGILEICLYSYLPDGATKWLHTVAFEIHCKTQAKKTNLQSQSAHG